MVVGKGLESLNLFMYKLKEYCLSPGILCELFDAFVSSILNYDCEVWGFSKSKDIEKIHLKFLKLLLGVKNQHLVWLFMVRKEDILYIFKGTYVS